MEEKILFEIDISQYLNLSNDDQGDEMKKEEDSEGTQEKVNTIEPQQVVPKTLMTKKIKKGRKKKKIDETSKWTDQDSGKYWLFYRRKMTQDNFTWSITKRDGTLNQMGEQCKSYEQRMKNRYFLVEKKDIPQVVYEKQEELRREFPEEFRQIRKHEKNNQGLWQLIGFLAHHPHPSFESYLCNRDNFLHGC